MGDQKPDRAPEPRQALPVASDGKYRFVRRVGRGGMGEVFEVEHVSLGRTMVAKLIHPELASVPAMLERFRIEAQALASLDHPNVVAVTDIGATLDFRPFMVMERLDGRTLADEIRARRAIPVGEALAIADQVLAALTAAHATGVVHRDVKPANIFLVGTSNPSAVKVLDWGIAKILPGRGDGRAPAPSKYPTAEGAIIGTPSYLAPEQILGRAVDERTDVYATALVLYRMLAGRGPFEDLSQGEMLLAQVSDAPAPPSSFASQPVPTEIDVAVMRALAKEPRERFQSAADFAAALREVLARSGRQSWAATEPLQTLERPGRDPGRGGTVPMDHVRRAAEPDAPESTTIALPPRRRSRLAAVALAAFVALAAAVVWLMVRP